jgi:predicted CxxxxCH...CXXCH cytochrome family protein
MDTQDPSVRLALFDSTNPSGAWVGDTGPETGACSSLFCHGAETPEWYGLAGVTQITTCAVCHGSAIGTRRQVMDAGGDFGKNPGIVSHHVTAGPGSDPGTDQCLVCHEMTQHMAGTVRLKNADTGAAIAYDPANPSSAEPFCLSCHDVTGALSTFRTGGTPTAPFIDGSVMGQAPNRASVEILTHWNKTFGHRRQGLTCIGNGGPNTGCHANGHGSAFVGILAKNLQVPHPDRYRDTDFDICFSCHGSFPAVTKEVVLGVRFGGNYDQPDGPAQNPVLRPGNINNPPYDLPLPGGIKTKFRDRNGQLSGNFYDNPLFFTSSQPNLHWFHIGLQTWNYRGTALNLNTANSGISCTACHSVHGSNTQFGMVYDSVLYGHTTVALDTFSMMSVDFATLNQYPTYCAFNCHDIQGTTHGWFEPANE